MNNSNEYIINEDYAELILKSPKYGIIKVKIDTEDVEKCKKYKWNVSRCNSQNYECFYVNAEKGRKQLHRLLTDAPKGMVVDHINGNTLDNRKSNLRICTDAENKKNCKLYENNKSGHKGVIWYHYGGLNKWMAYICVDNKRKTIGYFETIEEAINARKSAEDEYFGEFARN